MGAAAYNRGSRVVSRDVDAQYAASQATLDARRLVLRDVLAVGAIVRFRANDGAVVTCGPHLTACGPPQFSAYRDGGSASRRGSFTSTSSWAVALWVVEQVGRVRPIKEAP